MEEIKQNRTCSAGFSYESNARRAKLTLPWMQSTSNLLYVQRSDSNMQYYLHAGYGVDERCCLGLGI